MKNILFLTAFFFTHFCYAQEGLVGEYFNGTDFQEKIATRIDAKLDFYWDAEPPVPGLNPNECSVRWTGKLRAPESGTFTFSARVDDGIRVWVGGKQVINAWGLHDMGRFSGDVELKENQTYDLTVEYFNGLLEAELKLFWKLPSDQSMFGDWFEPDPSLIPPNFFSHVPSTQEAETSLYPEQKTALTEPVRKQVPKPQTKKTGTSKPLIVDEKTGLPVDTLDRYLPKNVMFERAQSEILPDSYEDLDHLAGFLKRNQKFRMKIEGHTDVAGDPAKNWQLSERRANAVAAYLVKRGVSASRLEARGFGSSQPIIPSDGKSYHPENRRVVFVLSPVE